MQLTRSQHGMALMEALAALMILAFGVLGLLWMHQQALLHQRQQLLRASAAGVAEDLAERMHLNAPQLAMYAKAWGSKVSVSVDCASSACAR